MSRHPAEAAPRPGKIWWNAVRPARRGDLLSSSVVPAAIGRKGRAQLGCFFVKLRTRKPRNVLFARASSTYRHGGAIFHNSTERVFVAARIFQVAYDRTLLHLRELALREGGYVVASAYGNPDSERLLADEAPFDAFLVGWSTTHDKRKAMVGWLKRRWPAIPVVAIQDSFQAPIPGADINTTHDTPEEWLAAVAIATRHAGGSSVPA